MMRNWWVVSLTALALAATLLLPVAPAGERLRRDVTPVPSGPGLVTEVRDLAQRLQLHHWADSLAPLAVAAAERGEAVAVGSAVATPEGRAQDEAYRQSLNAALARLPRPAEAPVALGRFQVDSDDGSPVDPTMNLYLNGTFLLAGTWQGRPYCITVQAQSVEYQERLARTSRLWPGLGAGASPSELLGACWTVARHGLPGPEVGRWYGAAGAHLATSHRPPTPPTVQELLRGRAEELPAFLHPARFLPVTNQRCLTGDERACAGLLDEGVGGFFLGPRVPAEAAQVVAQDLHGHVTPFPGVLDGSFLATLEDRFGPERFRAFWTSPHDFQRAFNEAFGVTPGAYVGQNARAAFGPLRRGPAPGGGGWLALGLVVLGGVGAGALVARRRRPA